jgi:hypothetical protein
MIKTRIKKWEALSFAPDSYRERKRQEGHERDQDQDFSIALMAFVCNMARWQFWK